jgi:hypothetical protein
MGDLIDGPTSEDDGSSQTKKPEYIAWREFVNGKLEEASYVINDSTGVMQIFRPNKDRTVECSSFFDGDHSIGETPGKTKNIKSLDKLGRDLLKLPEEEFKRKYPNVELYETRKRMIKVGERMIESID